MTLRLALLFVLILFLGCDGCSKEDPPDCPAGTADCPCREDASCDDGLVCSGDVCTTEVGQVVGLTIGSEDARSCEILLVETASSTIESASYGEGTSGALRRRDPNVAIAVARNDDTAFTTSSIALVVDGDVEELSLEARCFDASGAELSEPDVNLR